LSESLSAGGSQYRNVAVISICLLIKAAAAAGGEAAKGEEAALAASGWLALAWHLRCIGNGSAINGPHLMWRLNINGVSISENSE